MPRSRNRRKYFSTRKSKHVTNIADFLHFSDKSLAKASVVTSEFIPGNPVKAHHSRYDFLAHILFPRKNTDRKNVMEKAHMHPSFSLGFFFRQKSTNVKPSFLRGQLLRFPLEIKATRERAKCHFRRFHSRFWRDAKAMPQNIRGPSQSPDTQWMLFGETKGDKILVSLSILVVQPLLKFLK